MDLWEQSVETRLGEADRKIERNLLWVLAAFAAGFVILGGLMINRTDTVQAALSAKLDTLSGQVGNMAVDVGVLKARKP